MSNDQTARIERLEATQLAYIHKLNELRDENTKDHAAMHSDLGTIKEQLTIIAGMFKDTQEHLKRMDTRLIAIEHHNELLYQLVEQELQKREQKEDK